MKEGLEKDWRFDNIKTRKDDKWQKIKFKAKDELYFHQTKRSTEYTGQEFDSQEAEIRKGAWDHEHCLGCYKKISEDLAQGITEAYKNEHGEWICEGCYNDFFLGDK